MKVVGGRPHAFLLKMNSSGSRYSNSTTCSTTVGVIGAGYVGSELSRTLVSRGFKVVAFDPDVRRVEAINAAGIPGLEATTESDDLAIADLFCVCVPTPPNAHGRPDERALLSTAELLDDIARPWTSVVVESSVAPGATRRIFGFLREKNVFVSFSPERVDPGRTEPPHSAIPKLMGGLDEASYERCSAHYGKAFDALVRVSNAETAEFAKLYENTFRLVNIAFANEIADACGEIGIDHAEVTAAVSTKPFGLSGPFSAGLGAGGPCLPTNAAYLLSRFDLPILGKANEACSSRPSKFAREFVDAMREKGVENAFVYGLAFKPNVGTVDASPALSAAREIARILGPGRVKAYDPNVDPRTVAGSGFEFSEDWQKDASDAGAVALLVRHGHPSAKDVEALAASKVVGWSP